MTQSDTIQWWKKSFENTEFSQIPSTCPNVEQATKIWPQISSIILANVNITDNEEEYWKNIQSFCVKLTGKNDVPNPKTDILKFLDFIYINLDFFHPTLPEHCIHFIDSFCPNPCNDFFVLDFPRSINNPMLALRTYQYMQNKKHRKWQQFISENGAIGRLIDFYLPFLTPLLGQYDPIHWQYRLEMCDLIVTLITSHYESIPLIDEFIVSLNRQITLILSDAPPEIAADFVRYAVEICKISLPNIRPETASKRLLNYLSAAPPGTSAHSALVRYAYKIGCDFISSDSLVAALVKQGVTCSYDLEIVTQIACNAKSTPESQLVAARHLARVMTLDPFYSRSSCQLFAKLLSKLKEPETVEPPPEDAAKPEEQISQMSAKEWICLFVRRLVVFVALANAKGKYKGRIAAIAENLSNPALKSIKWFNDEVNRNVSAMVNAKLNPPYYADVFVKVDVPEDDKWMADYQNFEKEHITLKRFPFAATGNNLFDNDKVKGKKKKKKADGANEASNDEAGGGAQKETKKKGTKNAKNAQTTTANDEKNTEEGAKEPPKKKVRRPKWKP